MLVLAGRDAGIALDAALGVAKEFCSCHMVDPPLRCPDLAESGFGLLHLGY